MPNPKYLGDRALSVPVTQRVKETTTNERGDTTTLYHSVRIGTKYGTVALWVDVEGMLEQFGPRALLSSGGRAQLANGLIVVKVTKGTVSMEAEPQTSDAGIP